MKGRVLIVAGSDSGGGAGIQADIKAVTAMDAFAATAITALTAQNTLGVQAVEPVAPSFIAKQIEVVLTDIGADALKTGMLHSADVIHAVASAFQRHAADAPLVVDPVMVAKGGQRLLLTEAETALRETLLPMATVLTPNLPEAEVLAGFPVRVEADMVRAAERLSALGARAVLMKGGHLEGERVVDLLFCDGRFERFEDSRIASRSTHGTGCTLASATAAGLAQKLSLRDAVARARAYVRKAIETAPGLGSGHGPLNHAVTVRSDWR
ncbi:bifunctional hydroxymethylpyrimidine kinase/phosphomethylpyrimidine kinase [Reyranella sp.]|uniref:bifunctional hydroxymethylpyrimidine kinase/phosphomethylpyrimidine kinase n=1 Tax=Reyranella sp. TaxID=1929291 RepID=UPI002F95C243